MSALPDIDRAWAVASSVPDPELPMLTLADLGILRTVTVSDGAVQVELTPTYTGCPALVEMQQDVSRRLTSAGFAEVDVRLVLSPPWSTNWISEEGRRKLAAAGIAPPRPSPGRAPGPVPLALSRRRPSVACPHCSSPDTTEISAFGATACRSLYRCEACTEPFEYVKEN